jgi:hypothetical protein
VRTRFLVAVPGVLAGLYGAWLLLDQGLDNLRATAIWLAGGVVIHDGILAPAVLVVCSVATRLLPARARGPAVVGLIVLGTVTVVAIPVLGRFGARPDNPTLLDRPYLTGWLVVAGLTLGWVLLMSVLGARSRRTTTGSGSGQSSRG